MSDKLLLIIEAQALAARLSEKEITIIDCRFDLSTPESGYQDYLQAHIPGAVYAHLERDLSSSPNTDCGRHPMPAPADVKNTFERLGVRSEQPVVLYDAQGAMVAARAWWMLRRIGHLNAAILDGGWQAWCALDLPQEAGPIIAPRGAITSPLRESTLVTYEELAKSAANSDLQTTLIDAREPRRFRGEFEPIDPRAGHIPGAQNHFFQSNLDEQGKFLSAAGLRAGFQQSLNRLPDKESVHYCGSGVSACHNIFAQILAGLPEPKLYCGSWSEWSKLTPAREEANESGHANKQCK